MLRLLPRRQAAAVVLTVATLAGCSAQAATRVGSGGDDVRARDAASSFLRDWVDPDGRVVRRDQGADTVSEGQGYALLLAVAVDDRATFQRVWSWTAAHLQRPDGLLGFHWKAGSLIDATPAADADTQVAWALSLAGQRFRNPGYTDAARALARAVVDKEAGYDDTGQVTLAAGPWAVIAGTPVVSEPGYWTPAANAALASLTGDLRWAHLTAADTGHLRRLTSNGTALPPDWALLSHGAPRPTGSPDGGNPAQFGPDGMRAAVWNACTVDGRALLARLWPLMKGTADQAPLSRHLDGTVRQAVQTPLSAVATAAMAYAAGDPRRGHDLLGIASTLATRYPTYYGDAWAALGRVLLTTHRLGSCL